MIGLLVEGTSTCRSLTDGQSAHHLLDHRNGLSATV